MTRGWLGTFLLETPLVSSYIDYTLTLLSILLESRSRNTDKLNIAFM
jgi:hypothetical protein